MLYRKIILIVMVSANSLLLSNNFNEDPFGSEYNIPPHYVVKEQHSISSNIQSVQIPAPKPKSVPRNQPQVTPPLPSVTPSLQTTLPVVIPVQKPPQNPADDTKSMSIPSAPVVNSTPIPALSPQELINAMKVGGELKPDNIGESAPQRIVTHEKSKWEKIKENKNRIVIGGSLAAVGVFFIGKGSGWW